MDDERVLYDNPNDDTTPHDNDCLNTQLNHCYHVVVLLENVHLRSARTRPCKPCDTARATLPRIRQYCNYGGGPWYNAQCHCDMRVCGAYRTSWESDANRVDRAPLHPRTTRSMATCVVRLADELPDVNAQRIYTTKRVRRERN